MTRPKQHSVPPLDTEEIVILEGGEVWSLVDVMNSVSPDDWANFDPARSAGQAP